VVASFRQPFDLLVETAFTAARARAFESAKTAKIEIWLPFWTLIEPCASHRSLNLDSHRSLNLETSWNTFGRCSWPHKIKLNLHLFPKVRFGAASGWQTPLAAVLEIPNDSSDEN
jgi:hypothetical protein